MSEKTVSVVVVGIGGYGNMYMRELLNEDCQLPVVLEGVVDVRPENSKYYEQLVERKIPIYASMEEFYAVSRADLAIISTPIHLHKRQVVLAMQNGSHVLCEKPAAATPEEVREMARMQKQTGKFVAIGYGWCFGDQIQAIKKDIQTGLFGKPKRLKTVTLWERTADYYGRSSWAGRQKSDQGDWILDSVAHNATAHYLHQMFYVLGERTDASAMPQKLTAELYRANPIENFDTCALRAYTDSGTEILYYASHAILGNTGPRLSYEFEKAVITFDRGADENRFTAMFQDGSKKVYEHDKRYDYKKIAICVEAAAAGSLDILCGLEAAYPQVMCIHGMHQSVPVIGGFPAERVKLQDKTTYVEGLADTLLSCYDRGVLPSETGADWASAGPEVVLDVDNARVS